MSLIFIEKVPANQRAYVEKEINSICADLGIKNADWLSIVINRESNWNPAIKAKTSTATGLIQFLEATAKSLGTTTAKLKTMTVSQQLPYVREYLARMIRQLGKPKNLFQLYLLVHYPAGSKKGLTETIYASPSNAYTANKYLDKAGKGYVTGQDIENFLISSLPASYDKSQLTTQTVGINTNYLLYAIIVLIVGLFLYNPSYWIGQINLLLRNVKFLFTKKRFA
jgi:hypothetical protein